VPITDTKQRILDAAERLFAAHGFAGTSLRAITKEAGVNLAAVHYHFGTKEDLLRAVLSRIVVPVNRERLQMLEQVEAAAGDGPPSLEGILEAFIAPDLRLIRDLGERGVIITRFLGRSYTEPAEMVQALIREQYEELGQRFMEVAAQALPEVPQAELYWRFKLVVGVLTYILADTDRTGGYAEDLADVDETVRRLVAFLATGLRAPVPAPQGWRKARKDNHHEHSTGHADLEGGKQLVPPDPGE
jgi:AcrR family transcriptional regulator